MKKTFNQTLTETALMEDIDFSKPFKIMVDAPTGSGKTHYIINYLKDNNIPFVFLVDTLLLMNQISKTYGIDSYSAANRQNYNKSMLVTVYNHIESLYKNRVVIIDEAHSMVADYGYKKSVIDNLLLFGTESKQVILMSGTPLISNDEFYNNINIIKCTPIVPKEYKINMLLTKDSEDKYNSIVTLAQDMKSRGLIPVISLLDTKDKLNTVYDLLLNNGFDNIGLINSVVKDGEMDLDSTHYNELINDSILNADVIITTYVQGYNINNENCGLIIFPSSNKHSYIAIAQLVARFRRINNLEIYLLMTFNPDNDITDWYKASFDFNRLQQVTYETLYSEVVDFITKTKANYHTNRAIRHFINLDSQLSHLVDVNLEVDSQMLALNVINKLTANMYDNIITMNTILNQFNITIEINQLNLNTTTMTTTETKAIDYKIAVNNFFNNLEVERIPQTTMNLKVYEAYKDLKNNYKLLDSEIKEILLETFGNKKAFERVKLAMDFRNSNDKEIKQIRFQILTSFEVGKWYSSQEIKTKVQNILKSNDSNVSLNRAGEVFQFMFSTEESFKRIDGKITRGYKINFSK